jgi:RHS repeat-associated protein
VGADERAYTYDANGNTLTGGGRTFVWDAENRPTSITQDGETTSFVYGPDGGRIKVVEPNGNYTLYVGPSYERYVDPTPPTVVQTTPSPGQTDFPLGGVLEVRFSEAVVTGTFALTSLDSGQPVPGELAPLVDEGQVVGARFTPAAPLQPVASYEAQVSGFTDVLGNAQSPDPYAWTFSTAGLDYSDDLTGQVAHPPAAAWHVPGAAGWWLGDTVTYDEGDVCLPPEDDDGLRYDGQNPANDRFTVIEGTTANMEVAVTGTCGGAAYVRGWVDWDGNGVLETAIYNQTLGCGTHPVSFPVPLDSCQVDPVTMRWRIGETSDGPTGGSGGESGEVEDYVLEVEPVPPVVTGAAPSGAGVALEVVPAVVTMSEAVACPVGEDCGPRVTDLRSGEELAGTVGVAGAVVAFTPTAALSECTPYVGMVEQWADVCGGRMATAYTWNWYSVAIPPELVATTPGFSATEVPLESVVVVTMSEEMFYPAIQGAGCGITLARQGSGWQMPGETAIVGRALYFTPVVPLIESTWYTATVRGFVDSCGAPMESYTWAFRTQDIPPEVTAAVPLPGETCVPRDTGLLVTFTEEVSSVVGPDFTVSGPAGEVTGTAGFIRPPGVQSEEFWAWTAFFTPANPLQEKTWYAASIGGVEDHHGNLMEEPYCWGFQSRDETVPQVTATDPAANAPDGYPDEPVTAWFDEAVSWPSQVQGPGNHFTLVGPGGEVNGTIGAVHDLQGRSGIRFTPASTLTEQARFTATVVGAVDLCNNASLTHTWSFTTACLADAPAPMLSPGNCNREEASFQATGLPSGTVSSYEWDILAANGYEVLTTVVTTAPTLTRALPYPGQVRWLRVRGQDPAGCLTHWSAGQEFSWEACYPGAPRVVAVSPVPLSADVTVTTVLTVTFSEVVYAPPVDPDNVAQVRLQARGQEVAGQWEYADRYDDLWAWGARFTPTNDLAEKTWHLGSVTGMKDGHGYRMTVPYSWAFRTGDFSPPVVVATEPAGDGSDPAGQGGPGGVPQTVTAWFDEPLDRSRLGEVQFTLEGPAGPVTGSLELVDAVEVAPGDGLRFTPAGPLVAETRYTATVVGAVDLVGNQMVVAYGWTFTTGPGNQVNSEPAARVRKYYAFGGRPVALRESVRGAEAVFWLHPDHLGSTTLVTDQGGGQEAERRYLPWGGLRYEWGGEAHTGRLYTGQVLEAGVGLYYYGARWYDQALGRWISPDTIIPQPGNPQSLNRYSYVNSRPLNLNDPTGHQGYEPYQVQHDMEDAESEAAGAGTNYIPEDCPLPEGYAYYYADQWNDAYAIYGSDPAYWTYNVDIAELANSLYQACSAYGNLQSAWYTPEGLPPFIMRNIAFVGAMAQPSNYETLGYVGGGRWAAEDLDFKDQDIIMRAFRGEGDRFLKRGERGLSGYIGASPEEIHQAGLKGQIMSVGVGTVRAMGMSVIPTPGNLPGHVEIIQGVGMGWDAFKAGIKQIPWQ